MDRRWVDADAIPNIQHIGLSCWDRHVSYRNIEVRPPLDFATATTVRATHACASVRTLTCGPVRSPDGLLPRSGRCPRQPRTLSTLHNIHHGVERYRLPHSASTLQLPAHGSQRQKPRIADLVPRASRTSLFWFKNHRVAFIGPMPPLQDASSSMVPSLFDLTCASLGAGLSAASVFDTSSVAEFLLPNTRTLYRWAGWLLGARCPVHACMHGGGVRRGAGLSHLI